MRVMTWNIRLGLQQGVDALAEVIRRRQPELLAIQEVGSNWSMGPLGDTTASLAAACGLDHWLFVPTIEQGEARRFGHSLLSRHPIVESDSLALPQDVDEPRRLLCATIALPGHPLRIVATHLSHREPERALQRPALLAELARQQPLIDSGGALILLGDLNCDDAPSWLKELDFQLADADGELRRSTYPADAPEQRLDYLLCAGGLWTDVVVGSDQQSSDHRCVDAELHFPPSAGC